MDLTGGGWAGAGGVFLGPRNGQPKDPTPGVVVLWWLVMLRSCAEIWGTKPGLVKYVE